MPHDLVQIEREAVSRGGLAAFCKLAWPLVEPSRLRWNWHHDLICDRLERVSRGEIRKLAIFVPPGTTKTLLTGVFWPSWSWVARPSLKWIFATYGASLGLKAARQHRTIVQSGWFRERWPGCQIPYQNTHAAQWFENTAKGFRFSASVGGEVTGRHADSLVGDDLNKAQDAMGSAAFSLTALDASWEFWATVLPTRQVDPVATTRVLIGQRLHERDVPGRWIDADPTVHVLCLPMRYSAAHPWACPDDPRSEGELLWPEHLPESAVQALEEALGPTNAAAQLDQLPVPAGGAVFRRDWVRHYRHLPVGARQVQSWDMAFKGGDESDHVVGQVWARDGDDGKILDQVRGRWDFVETCDQLVDLTLRWPDSAREVLIEDKANGPAVEAELARSFRERCRARGVKTPPALSIRLVPPRGGKLARANAVTGLWSSGHVLLPESAPWLSAYLHELLRFSGRGAEQDDQVDATTQALTYLFGSAGSRWADAMARARDAMRRAS